MSRHTSLPSSETKGCSAPEVSLKGHEKATSDAKARDEANANANTKAKARSLCMLRPSL